MRIRSITCFAAAAVLGVVVLACAPAAAEELTFEGEDWAETATPGEGTPAAELAEIRLLLRTDKLRSAFRAARAFVKAHPNDPLTEEALLLAGEAQLQRRRWWSAYAWLEKLTKRYPGGALYERALRREAVIGEAFLAGAKRRLWGVIPVSATDEGIQILQRVADRLPGSTLAASSLMRIGDFQVARERWVEAAATYQTYVERFRGRYDSDEAMLKEARATYAQFAGVQRDDTALIEAEQLYRQYLAQYAGAPGAEEAADAVRTIRDLRAEKDYLTARFYERIGRPVSARIYYRDTIAQHPGTSWAARSAGALRALGDDNDQEPAP